MVEVQNLVGGLDYQVAKELAQPSHEMNIVVITLELILLVHEYIMLQLE